MSELDIKSSESCIYGCKLSSVLSSQKWGCTVGENFGFFRVPGIVRHNLCFRRSRDTAECGQGPSRLAPEGVFEPAKSR